MNEAVTPDIPEPDPSKLPRRLWPDEPLPPYRYVPLGRHPHPTMDPGGHMREDRVEPPLEPPSERAWMTNRFFLFGVDLFNHRYYWEATETWEPIWKKLDKDRPDALMIQAMMMSAGAFLKLQQKEPLGVSAFWQGANERFLRCRELLPDAFLKPARLWGLPITKTHKAMSAYFAPAVALEHEVVIDESVPVVRLKL